MDKEIVISVILILVIVSANFFGRNYMKENIQEVMEKLNNLGTKMEKGEESLLDEFQELETMWKEKSEILSYYVEHDELEKVSTELFELKGKIKMEQNEEGYASLEKCMFILEHIEDKYAFTIKNIF